VKRLFAALLVLAAGCSSTPEKAKPDAKKDDEAPAAKPASPRPEVAPVTTRIEAGPLRLTVSVSRTAQVFHVVDQLSAWSPFCHLQYSRVLHYPESARQLLADHAAIRARLGWNHGLERALYTTDDVDTALERAVRENVLTADEASRERKVLDFFDGLLDEELRATRPRVEAFAARIASQAPAVGATATKLMRLVGIEKVLEVPVFLIWNPADIDTGGGFNGGVLALEVPVKGDALPTFMHEIFHAILNEERGKIASTAQAAQGLDAETLNEGIAYALSPGILHEGEDDPLADQVADDRFRQRPFENPYVRFNRFGLEIRPILVEALAKPTGFDAFLARTLEAWDRVSKGN
jgi:hypothetical protein